jgi:mono/diheme cytochrome c family protein
MWKIQPRSLPSRCVARPHFNLIFLGVTLAAAPLSISMGQSLEEGLLPGLVVHYSLPDGQVISDIAESPRFDFRHGLPNTDLRTIPQQITYQGLWLPDGKGTYQWTLSGQGQCQILVNGNEVGSGSVTAKQSLQTRAFETDADWQTIEIQFQPDGNQSFLRISTSNPKFLPEPLPPLRLAHEDLKSNVDSIANGRMHFDTYRCQACHTISRGWELETSPAFFGKRSLPANRWLRNWLESHSTSIDSAPQATAAKRREPAGVMPRFALSNQDIEDLMVYMTTRQKKQSSASTDEVDPKLVQQGERLYYQTGCIACHAGHEQEEVNSRTVTDLRHIGSKRSSQELSRWLENPRQIDPAARMHPVPLTEVERNAIAAYLTNTRVLHQDSSQDAISTGDFERGQKVYQENRCAACHEIENDPLKTSLHGDITADGQPNCMTPEPNANGQPSYRMSDQIRSEISAFIKTLPAEPAPRILAQKDIPVSLQLRRLGCINCHERQFNQGITPQLNQELDTLTRLGVNPVLVRPPALNGVGDKLTDLAWSKILGEGLSRRDWLAVRMPRYQLDTSERDLIQAHFQAMDEQAEGVQPDPVAVDAATAAITGPRLVTTDGFGCTSCHAVGKQSPSGSEPQNLGPSLSQVDRWIRRPWFERWVRAPARITPWMEMPSLQIPVPGILDNDLDRQLSSLWTTVNQPGFEPPRSNPVRVVRRSSSTEEPRALALTDVMKVGGATMTKPFVIGLPNRNSILFDLDKGRLSHWWLGDVARQYTEGKTWFWEPGGVPLFSLGSDNAEWQMADGDTWISPIARGQFTTEAEGWRHLDDGLELTCLLTFPLTEGPRTVKLIQHFRPIALPSSTPSSSQTGFLRTLRWEGLKAEQRLRLNLRPMIDGNELPESTETRSIELTRPFPWRFSVQSNSGTWLAEARAFEFIAQRQGALMIDLVYSTRLPVDEPQETADPTRDTTEATPSPPTVVPGFLTEIIPIDKDWMPTALTWSPQGHLYVASLKGRIWEVLDTDNDQLEDKAHVIGDELAAPFGIFATDDYVDVLNKFALLRLTRNADNESFDNTQTLASGWGHTVDYHDWAVGLPREPDGSYLMALPCQQDQRPMAASQYRGQVLRLHPPTEASKVRYQIEAISGGHRFPIGLARNHHGDVVVTDNQGNYNPFNELNHVQSGKRYGFINAWEKREGLTFDVTPPAINIPHPWTRSVNGICFLESSLAISEPTPDEPLPFGPFHGHLIGCEYDTRRLVRMSLENVDGVLQGAVYPFSSSMENAQSALLGPITCAVSPRGELYIGGIRDSGWGGANNLGTLLRLKFKPEQLPDGLATIEAMPEGFRLTFTNALDRDLASDETRYMVESYTRISTPQYGGPDAERRKEPVSEASVSADGKSVEIRLSRKLREGFVYDFNLDNLTPAGKLFFPSEGYYTLNRIPKSSID